MKFNPSKRYSDFFVLVIRSCQGFLLLILVAIFLSMIAVSFGAGSIVGLLWSLSWIWLLRCVPIAMAFLFASILYEALR